MFVMMPFVAHESIALGLPTRVPSLYALITFLTSPTAPSIKSRPDALTASTPWEPRPTQL